MSVSKGLSTDEISDSSVKIVEQNLLIRFRTKVEISKLYHFHKNNTLTILILNLRQIRKIMFSMS